MSCSEGVRTALEQRASAPSGSVGQLSPHIAARRRAKSLENLSKLTHTGVGCSEAFGSSGPSTAVQDGQTQVDLATTHQMQMCCHLTHASTLLRHLHHNTETSSTTPNIMTSKHVSVARSNGVCLLATGGRRAQNPSFQKRCRTGCGTLPHQVRSWCLCLAG